MGCAWTKSTQDIVEEKNPMVYGRPVTGCWKRGEAHQKGLFVPMTDYGWNIPNRQEFIFSAISP